MHGVMFFVRILFLPRLRSGSLAQTIYQGSYSSLIMMNGLPEYTRFASLKSFSQRELGIS